MLAARDPARCPAAGDELRAAGAEHVETVAFDARDAGSHEAFAQDVFTSFGDIDMALVAFGVLAPEQTERDPPLEIKHSSARRR